MEVIADKITIIKCGSQIEYLSVLEYADKNFIPVMDSRRYELSKFFQYRHSRIQTISFPDCNEQFPKTSYSSVHELAKQIISTVNINARPGKVIVASDQTLGIALCLAKHLGYGIRATDLSSQPADTSFFDGNEYIWFTGLSAEIGDTLMFSILKYVKDCFDNCIPLDDIPAFSFCTGRDAEQLSYLALKIVLARSVLPVEDPTFISIQPQSNAAQFHLSGFNGNGDEQVVTVKDFRDFFANSGMTDMVTCATHGFESCANGGNGNVFCGLKQDRKDINLYQYTNNLGCGFGLTCPRGPLPFAMEQLPARIFMLASCNALRLADNILNENFNLALSFLDGYGEAYISNFYSSSANTITVVLFNALIRSGYTLAKAVNLLNLFLIRSGLDHPAVLMIGEPGLALSDVPPVDDCQEIEFAEAPFNVALNAHLLQACVTHKRSIENIDAGEMALLYETGRPGEELFWFTYRQQGENDKLSVFIFGQSGTDESMLFQFIPLSDVHERLKVLHTTAAFWIRYIGYLGDADHETAELIKELQDLVRQVEEYRDHIIRSAAYTCIDKTALGKLELWAETMIKLARQTYLEIAWTRVSGASFWLLNSYSHDFKIKKLGYAVCPNCHGQSIAKELSNLYTPELRYVAVCPKCGIIEDTAFPQIFSNFFIAVPDEIYTNSCLRVSVEFTCNYDFPDTEFTIVPGISSFGLFNYVPDPPAHILSGEEQSKRYRFNFVFNLEDRIPSHRYFLKVLVASANSISFFSRPFFIRQPEPSSS